MKNSGVFGLLILAIVAVLFLTAGNGVNVSPSARGYHQMAYDSESGLVILYGGQTGYWLDPAFQNHETWSFNPKSEKWKEMSPNTSPGGFAGGDMAYDSESDRIILSVITDNLSALQTWAYDANSDTWTRMADGPQHMVGQRIAYDSESDRIIMFGGFEFTKYLFVDETWVYDFNSDTWTNMETRYHPQARNYHDMAYDPKADRIVLWGGDLNGRADKDTAWTYDYNTNTWEELNSKYANAPELRDYMNLEYDEKADKFIMYGGYSYGNDETWTYDLNTNTWQQMQPENNPGVISRYAMVYVPDTNETILFGGQDGALNFEYVGGTWGFSLKNNKWVKIASDD